MTKSTENSLKSNETINGVEDDVDDNKVVIFVITSSTANSSKSNEIINGVGDDVDENKVVIFVNTSSLTAFMPVAIDHYTKRKIPKCTYSEIFIFILIDPSGLSIDACVCLVSSKKIIVYFCAIIYW